ncbi:helix-turn-helix domain-containing protein [Pseudostreptobacillus hongkongensis]|uniref:helix-turn-helix domain-containing protein n=1 Tax=Pseudostreptobacillus hongkongensis TaxID=1162717 RepID=UPI00082ED941|nr:helix-turn-helix transcriptional regulator [Pseudostreptobacillus hongkongensis]
MKLEKLEKLKNLINKKGLKFSFIARKLGITPTAFSRKMKNKSDFQWEEINELIKILQLNEEEKKFFLD